jgi:hypothetical protein
MASNKPLHLKIGTGFLPGSKRFHLKKSSKNHLKV